MRQVAEALDAQLGGTLLHNPAKRVVVAGTNGKGSCVAALGALLRTQGKQFGTYSSPHLLQYNERVQLNGEPVSDADLCRAFAAIDAARGTNSLSYFEFGTLAALWLFAQQPLDVWLLEVGLGGRLDAVNVLDADVAVITSIALDHQAWLGETREAIGFEKAGVCRATSPVVCVEPDPPHSLCDHIARLECPAFWLGRDFFCGQTGASAQVQLDATWQLQLPADSVFLPLPSVAAALKTLELLDLLPSPTAAAAALAQTHLAGRMQRSVQGTTEVILDVAHNPASTTYLAQQLTGLPGLPTFLVVGMMADKDLAGSLAPLVVECRLIYCADLVGNNRAASADQLVVVVHALGGRAQAHSSVAAALNSALAQAALLPAARVVVCGSFFTVADALLHLASLAEVNHG